WVNVLPAQATPASDSDRKAALIGQPSDLVVQPSTIDLSGPHAVRQLVVSGRYTDGSVRDLTPFCALSAEPANIITIDSGGLLVPVRAGTAILTIQAGGRTVRAPVTVTDFTETQHLSFRNQLAPVLSVGGCNAGTCHGSPTGKNGFRLSLRGFDPAADYRELTRAVLGRRVNSLEPEASLLFQKAIGAVPHEGGQRFARQSLPAQWLRAWLAEGMPDDRAAQPVLQRLEVLPGARTLTAPARGQQLAVLGHFSDGTVRDVTRLSVFSSSAPAIAEVNANGHVEFGRSGEVAILCRHQDQFASLRLTYLEPRPGFRWNGPVENNYVDRHVFAKLQSLSIRPSGSCTDEEFIRRAFLDLCGILPTPAEIKDFLARGAEDKRARLIDELLGRSEYADFWALKWADLLRLRSSTHRTKGVILYHQWLRRHLDNNTPFDRVTRELLTGSGNTFANPAANYYRIGLDIGRPSAKEVRAQLTEITAQVFCGVRIQCAKCHNHPLERWTQDDYYGLSAFFARLGRKAAPEQLPADSAVKARVPSAEIVYSARAGEVLDPRTGRIVPPRYLGGPIASLSAGEDRRAVLAAWLTSPKNPFFARSLVNRVWFHLLGRGIVDPVDDFRDSNPPANQELLDALAEDFIAHNFDLKHLIRVICTSQTYGRSAHSDETNPDAVRYFACAVTKQYSAEQLIDAVCAATEVPEKYPGLPSGTRAVQIPDGDFSHGFMKTFHKPTREMACECERETEGSLAQALQFVNGRLIKDKLAHPNNRIGRLLARQTNEKEILDELYLATLSRYPTAAERQAMLSHVSGKAGRREAWADVQWALLNSLEFRFRH
ncbi:MAG TPA: DUF1549 and DUF1553 domain-containing protein, partial [Gemmataceae bacterium]|nr:DUF1549 and DUF1553 domain-containing protein [Gemmataceae bacterium]